MLESNKDSAKLDAMKRIVGVGQMFSILTSGSYVGCDYIHYAC